MKESPTVQTPVSGKEAGEDDEEEEDYMSMAIPEPSTTAIKETYTARRERLAREAESSRTKSKAEIAAAASAAREKALATALPSTSRGFKMLSKLGFQPGETLGAKGNPDARAEPLELDLKVDRGGIGMDSERKRKVREAAEGAEIEAKRVKESEGDFRERVGRERETERLERLVGAAMRVAERMDEECAPASVAADLAGHVQEREGLAPETKKRTEKTVPIAQVNVLWRGLVKERLLKERDRRMRHDLMQSISGNPSHDDDDTQEKTAFGTTEEELEEEDPELDKFNALEPMERLMKLVKHLRERYHYCFWCKYRYEDEKMEDCPGLLEEDHD